MPGDKPIVVVADLRVMKLEAGVSELEAGRLRVGMTARVVGAGQAGRDRSRASSRRSRRSRRAQPPLPDRGARAEPTAARCSSGMYATARIVDATAANAVAAFRAKP